MPHLRRHPQDPPADVEPDVDLNEVVAYNFRRARDLRGWSQSETAERLAPYLGARPPQASISAFERAAEGGRRREFDAHEIAAFAAGFDLPMVWFFIPAPGDTRKLRNLPDRLDELYALLLGRNDQLDLLAERFREVGIPEATEDDGLLERLHGTPTDRSLWDYRRRRKEVLLALLDAQGDELDRAADELGRFFDHLRQVGVRGLVAEKALDADFMLRPKDRGKGRTTAPAAAPARRDRARGTTE